MPQQLLIMIQAPNCFIESFIEFHKNTEAPTIYYRWAAIAGIGAILGRNCWLQHGHTKIYPNQYIMLVGDSGARKSTAVLSVKKLLIGAQYKTISADRTTKEKFLIDLEEGIAKSHDPEEVFDVRKNEKKNPTMRALFGQELSTEPSECLICADEFNSFLGHGNVEFIDLLTNLWSYDGIYENRIKNGRSVRINNPTLSILGGNTGTGISMAFPLEVIGQGLFSRLVMVYSDPSGRRITFPPPPDPIIYGELVQKLMRIRATIKGELVIEPFAKIALDDIYSNWKDMEDVRFKTYSSRRFTHLLKLCLCVAAGREETTITTDTVIFANTILHYTEYFMPKALGEFGKARNSDVAAKILEIIEKSETPVEIFRDIWPQVRRDLDNRKQLGEILDGLRQAGKIQQVGNEGKLLPVKQVIKWNQPHCKITLLQEYLHSQAKDCLPL